YLPRRNRRGLIEARHAGQFLNIFAPIFRGVIAAASLKQGDVLHDRDRRLADLPRRNRRVLIEAGRTRWRPPATCGICRGVSDVETSNKNYEEDIFRGVIAAASLKRACRRGSRPCAYHLSRRNRRGLIEAIPLWPAHRT